MYYVIPRIYKCKLFSRKLANVQYALYVIGFTFFFTGFMLTGLVQGTSWLHEGLPVWAVLPGLTPLYGTARYRRRFAAGDQFLRIYL